MRPDGIIVHYAEVATKGKNRPQFIKRLAKNLGAAIAGLPLGKVERLSGRLWIRATGSSLDLDDVRERITTVYGLSSYSPALRARLDLDDLKQKALQIVEGREYDSFRVSSRRVFKDQPLGSLEVDREV
ncbi:MAG: THUMP domain-containing protein, partial [Myxococcota bacterium]